MTTQRDAFRKALERQKELNDRLKASAEKAKKEREETRKEDK